MGLFSAEHLPNIFWLLSHIIYLYIDCLTVIPTSSPKAAPSPMFPHKKASEIPKVGKKHTRRAPGFFWGRFFMKTLLERVCGTSYEKIGCSPKKDPFARTGTGKLFQWVSHLRCLNTVFQALEFLRKCVDIMWVNPEVPPPTSLQDSTCEFGNLFNLSVDGLRFTLEVQDHTKNGL